MVRNKLRLLWKKMVRWGLFLALLSVVLAGGFGLSRAEEAVTAVALPPTAPQQSRTINYTYDGAGRLLSANYGPDALIVYTYDKGGNLLYVGPGQAVYLPLALRGSLP